MANYGQYNTAHGQQAFIPTQPPPQNPAGYGYAQDGAVAQDDGVNGMTAAMHHLGVAVAPPPSTTPTPASTAASRTHRRKDRHAHHDIGPAQAATPQPLGGPQFLQQQQQYAPQQQQQPQQEQQYAQPQYAQQQQQQYAQQQYAQPPPAFVHPADKLRMGEEAVTTQGRVDPEQVPSVARARDLATNFYQTHVYATMEKHLPPPAAVPFVAYDQGNSSPKYARLTINNIPATAESLASTGLPLGLIIQPLAPTHEGEQPIPVLDFGDSGPPRCRRCRAYINPFMTFRSGGNKLVCNMCSFPNDVAPDYFAPTDPSGVRVDRGQRPELTMGTVEYLVPKEYWAKEPVPLRWLFLVDVSQEAINRGFLHTLPAGIKVGIISYDRDVHFYDLSAGLAQPQMYVVTDLDDPFVALSTGLFVDPVESRPVIESLLQSLPTMFSLIKNPEPALLPTLNAALAALSATGGKVIATCSALPTFGPGRLHLRDDGKGRDSDHERRLFTTDHAAWKKSAQAMVSSGIGVDFFLASPGGAYMDVATIGHLARLTGGDVFFYPNFVSPRDSAKVEAELSNAFGRETGFQALVKVRCSNGLQVASYHGAFLQHAFGADLEIGTIDADKTIGVVFSYDGKLDPKLDAHFQAAVLYTSATGQRRVRCINVVAGVSEGAAETMRTVDQDAVVNIIAKESSSKVSEKSLKDIRAGLTEKTIDILSAYRKNFSGSHPPGQLVLPEHLKEFAMYMLGLIKSRAFKGGIEPTDRRVHAARFLRSASVTEVSLYLYPRIYSLHNLSPTDCFPNPETNQLVLPPSLRASFSRVEDGGVYIVDNGQLILLWLHASVSPNLLEDLFGPGIGSLSDLDPMLNTLPVLETHLNAQARNLLAYLATVRGSKAATIQLARQGLDGSEFEYARMLVEDRNNEAQSYVDWLVHVHRAIQMELSGQRRRDDGEAEAEGILHNLVSKTNLWT
ncbi:hypothetical protein DV737_g5103, partial [Chaetothyriales sp. CBS 132003]